MANAFYPKALNKFAAGLIHWSSGGDTFTVHLVYSSGAGTNYTFSTAHEFLSDIAATCHTSYTTGVVLTTCNTPDSDGAMDANDATFVSIDANGTAIGSVIIAQNTGTAATSPLIAYFDTGSGLPVTPDGNNITVQWSAATPYIMGIQSTA
jgi:hypothetical protein